MADNIIIGAIKAILSLEDTGFTAGLAAAETSVAKFKYSSDQMIAGMSAAGKEATASGQMIAGMSAAGQQAAAGMEQAATGVSTLSANFGKMAATVGGLFVLDQVVGAVVDFGREAVTTASHIVDLSNKTGLSVESIQRMSFVAEQAGGSLEGFTTAAFKLGVNIEKGSTSVTEAVKVLGLSLQNLRDMKPDEQFETIVAALGKIDDAQLRNKLGVELFGKSFAQIAGAVAEGYDKIADKATVSTDAQLKAIDDLADEWNAFYDSQVKKALSVLGELAHGWNDAAKAQKMAADMTSEQRDIYMTLLTQMEQGVKTMDLSTAAAIAMGKGFDVALPPSRTSDADSFVKKLAEIDASLAALTVSELAELKAGIAIGEKNSDLEARFDLADGAVKRFTATTREHAAEAKKAAEEQAKFNKAVEYVTDKDIIRAVTDGLKEGTEWLQKNTTANQLAAEQWAKWHPILEGVGQDFTRIDLSRLTDEAIALHGPLVDLTHDLELMLGATTTTVDLTKVLGFGTIHTEAEQAVIDFDNLAAAEQRAREKTHETAEGMRAIGQSFMELGQIFTDSDMKGVFAGAGLFMNNLADWTENGAPKNFAAGAAAIAQGAMAVWESTDSASKGVNALNGAMAGAGAGMAFGPYGAAVGAAAGALVGLVKASENAKQEVIAGNEILEQWTHTMAGMFDEVGSAQDKAFAGTSEQLKTIALVTRTYEDLGFTAEETTAVIEKLWEAQDLGPDAVKLVLDDINDQMERHAQIMKQWADGVNTYIEGFTTRVEGFSMGLEDIRQKQEEVNSVTEITKQRYDEAVQAVDRLKASGTASQEEIVAATEKAHQAWAAYQNAQTSGAALMSESLVSVQEQFGILEQYAVTAFTTTISNGGSLIEAMGKIHEPLTTLQTAMKDFGLEGSATFTKLTEIDGVIQANKDIFTSIDGLNEMMKGLGEATLLTQEDMDLFGKDAVLLFDTLVKRMEDHGTPAAEAMNTAMMLMQPTLQTLWEGQEKFGLKIDGATQELIDQAVQAGLVGEQHKSIQAQILTAIEGVEAAILRLPAAFAASFANADTLLSKLQTIGTAAGQIQIGLGSSTGTGGVATSVTDVQNDLMDRWEQMYGTRDIPPDVKHAQNQAAIQQGFEPIWPGFKKGGLVSDWLQSMYGPGAVPIVAHVGEGILNPFATAALGGKSGLDALNTNPWSAVQRMASMQMPSPTGTASAPMSSGGMTIGDINITVHAPGGDPQAVARATKSAFDEWYDEVESGRGASRYRRLHQQVVVT